MTEKVQLALVAGGFLLLGLAVNRWLQWKTAQRKAEILSDDDPRNDDAFDVLERDLAEDTEKK